MTAPTAPRRLPVVLLWHMHQPHYRDALTGEYVFPWTYLHAIKDYSDMAAHLEANPKARAVVNFTPVLLEQLAELAASVAATLGGGARLPDPLLAMLGPEPLPSEPAARLELLKACLRANREHLIERFEPFRELATLADSLATPERIGYASDALLHDLAVWYHLAWLGESLRIADPRVAVLVGRAAQFRDADRRLLLGLIGETLAGIIPRYGALAKSGRCELSVSPYSHPILPLLYDFRTARESVPDSTLPAHAGYPGGAERASWHMDEAIRVFRRHFGFAPRGCWPSEGAVSTASVALVDRSGFDWLASSANVLRASVEATGVDRPYQVPGQRLQCFFRDDGLSDLIGFKYATWHGDDAAANLVFELETRAKAYADDPGRCVLVALDGENAWEYYPFNGYYFLRALYAALAGSPLLELTTLGAVVDRRLPPARLERLVAGSWVHGTLATWVGDPSKNAGWDLLCEAKLAYDRVLAAGGIEEPRRIELERQLARCESSDWFWWFGDYNPAEAVASFDLLYRRQLTTLYRMLGLEPPAALSRPVSVAGSGSPEHGGAMRRGTA
jgi:alpha-amylase/alpha-mannosidase (GH57 family)